jgi:hypothetical protein
VRSSFPRSIEFGSATKPVHYDIVEMGSTRPVGQGLSEGGNGQIPIAIRTGNIVNGRR